MEAKLTKIMPNRLEITVIARARAEFPPASCRLCNY